MSMSRRPYHRVAARGVTFVFKYDDVSPQILHIYARHLTEPFDAISAFFEPIDTPTFNPAHDRWEQGNGRHRIYWFWIEEPRVAMIITCFNEDDDAT